MLDPGAVTSYRQVCDEEHTSLQRGMNYRLGGKASVVLMNVHPGAPYADRVEEDRKVLSHNSSHQIGMQLIGVLHGRCFE